MPSIKLPDPYLDWARGQGVPIVEDFGIDIRKVPVAPWARYGMNGALCHLKGRDDYISIFAMELPPGEGYAWCAGEAHAMGALRRLLVEEKGHDRRAIRAAAYWKRGASAHHENLEE